MTSRTQSGSVEVQFSNSLVDVLKESPRFKKAGIDVYTLKEKVDAFLSDTKKSHYLDEFLRILLNPDSLKIIDPPHRGQVLITIRQPCTVYLDKAGLSIPLPGADPSKASGFIKGTISSSVNSISYKKLKASQVESDPNLMVDSLRLIVEPKDDFQLSFILEFTFSKSIKASQLTFKICNHTFNAIHEKPLVFMIDRRGFEDRTPATKSTSIERSADYSVTGSYRFKSKEEIDDYLAKYYF